MARKGRALAPELSVRAFAYGWKLVFKDRVLKGLEYEKL